MHFLFDYIIFEHNGNEIERDREPGITSLIRTLLCYNAHECNSLQIAGFQWPDKASLPTVDVDKFTFQLPFSHLFGIFRDYALVMRGRFKFRFVRSRTDNNCYKTTNVDNTLKITLKSVSLLAKQVYPNQSAKLSLLNGLRKNRDIPVIFRKWMFHELPALRRGNKEIWSVTSTVNKSRPQFVIVALQTKRKDNISADCTLFDHVNMLDVKVYLNSYCYPFEPQNLHFNAKNYADVYRMYSDFQSYITESNRQEPLLTYEEFKDRTIFVIDTTKCNDEDKTLSTPCDVRIELHSNTDFPENTKAYCILITECLYTYKPLTSEIMTVI